MTPYKVQLVQDLKLIRHPKRGPEIDLLKKVSSFQIKLIILILAAMETSKIVAFGTQITRTYTLKSQCTQNYLLFGANIRPEA